MEIKILKYCKKYLLTHKVGLIVYVMISVVSCILSLVNPYITGNFFDGLISNFKMNFVYKYCFLVTCITVGSLLINYVSCLVYAKLQIKMGYEFNKDVIFHTQDLPLLFSQKIDLAYLNQTINEDTNSLIIFCMNLFQSLLMNLIKLPLLIYICLNLNLTISISFFFIILLYIILYLILKTPLFKVNLKIMESQNKFFSMLFEQLQFIKFIKVNGENEYFRERLKEPFNNLYRNTIMSQKFFFLYSSIDNIISLIGQIVLFLLGGWQITNGTFTIGKFIIFTSYFGMIITCIRYFFGFGKTYQNVLVSYGRLKKITSEKKEKEEQLRITNIDKVKINNLNIKFDDNIIFKNFFAIFEKGKMYCIIGENGSGKTTLINVLLGLYNEIIEDDSIFYNSIDIKKLNLCNLRKTNIAFVEQETVLFVDNIKNNIYLSRINDEDSIKKFNKLSNILNLERIIDENATDISIMGLSGGERQKISIIRALSKASDLIILDEPTSALDKTRPCLKNHFS